jgi:MoaA/NifB/PqqE/SkfB family radical SAM enzyme
MKKDVSLRDRIHSFVLQYPSKTNKEIAIRFGLCDDELKDIFREIKDSSSFLLRGKEIESYSIFYISTLKEIIRDKDLISSIINRTVTYPKTLELHLGPYCQLNCIFCQTKVDMKNSKYADSSYNKLPLSKEKIFNIIDEFASAGGEKIIFSGGLEPFTSNLTIPAIEYSGEKNLNISIYSNGLSKAFKDSSTLRKILKYTRTIRFSIHAITPETYHLIQAPHVTLSQAKRLFEQAISAAKKTIAIKKSEYYPHIQIGIAFLLIKENIEELIPALRFWETSGIDFLDVRNDILDENAILDGNCGCTIKLRELHEYMNKFMSISFGRRFPRNGFWGTKSCYAPYRKVVLDLWGEFHACCLRAHRKSDSKTTFGYYQNKGDYTYIIQNNLNRLPISPACKKCCDREIVFNSCIQKIITDIKDGYSLHDSPYI